MKKEMRFLAVVTLLLISFSSYNASAQEIQKGDFILSPGLGFGYVYAGGVTISVNGEYAFTDEISGGGYLAYTRWDHSWSGPDVNYSFIDFGVRASYHFAKLLRVTNKQFDPYAGAMLGAVISDNDYNGNGYYDEYDGGVRGGLYAGARYYFQPNIGVYGEVGWALSPITIGVTFKF